MVKKRILFVLLFLFFSFLSAQDFSGKRIAVLEPTLKFGEPGERWITIFAQGQLTSIMQNYSGMIVIDRQNIDKAINELKLSELEAYSEKEQLEVGKFLAANYIVVVSIVKKGNGFAVDAKINNTETGVVVGKAYSNPNCTTENFENGSVLNELAYELLSGLGVAKRKLAAIQKNSKNSTQKNEIETIKKDSYVLAFKKYEEKAFVGDAMAQFVLGTCYVKGLGTRQDFEQAVYWYSKAAEQRNTNAQAMLGYCYYNGYGVKQDYSMAVYWYEKAADKGHGSAQGELALCYYNGIGVKKDYTKAVYLFRKLAERGLAEAQLYLGYCYFNEQGVQQDYTQAVYWYRKAAEQGLAAAQYYLGYCYAKGQGVKQDYTQAVYLYRKAAEQGDRDAQYFLGGCYFNGQGVQQDKSQAVYWFRLAAKQGHDTSIEILKKLGVSY